MSLDGGLSTRKMMAGTKWEVFERRRGILTSRMDFLVSQIARGGIGKLEADKWVANMQWDLDKLSMEMFGVGRWTKWPQRSNGDQRARPLGLGGRTMA